VSKQTKQKALVNCCTIDWFTEWPEEALRTVAGHFLNTLEMEDKTRSGLVDVCVQMQEMVTAMSLRYRSEMGRFYYVTPTSYLELISTFKGLLNSQRQEVYTRVGGGLCVCSRVGVLCFDS
jgi:dynein heavy chain